MLQKFEITGVHFEIDKPLHKYITKKLGDLDRYLPKHGRDSAHMEVRLWEAKVDGKAQAVCEVTLHVPHEKVINLKESAITMYAATDIMKNKLKQQITKYKEEFTDGKQRRHIFGRLRHRLSSALPDF